MIPLFDRLNPPLDETPDHCHSGQLVCDLDSLQALQEDPHVLHLRLTREGTPTYFQRRWASDISRQSKIGVGNIEPPAMPTLQRISQGQTDILGRPTMSQLNQSSSNYNWPSFLPSRHLENMAEQCKMGLDSQVHLTEVDESVNVEDGVWIQMDKFNLVKIQKTPEESVGWDRKSAVKERLKNHNLTGIRGRESFSISGTPTDDLLLRKNPVLDHPIEILLCNGGPLPHLLRRGNYGH